MALLDRLRRRAPDAAAGDSPRPHAALKMTPGAFDSVEAGNNLAHFIATPPGQGAAARAAFTRAQASTYAFMYREQPAIRKVVDYIARNAAQIGVKLYERQGDTDVRQVFDHSALASMHRPGGRQTGRRFLFGLVADHLIYENAYALKFRPRSSDRIVFMRVPVWAMEVKAGSSYAPTSYRVHLRGGDFRDFNPPDVLHLSGYDPDDPGGGLSRLETLRQILAEEASNQAANVERLKHGGLGPGYLKRPVEAPEWSNEARERFESDWANRSKGRKGDERLDPVLEEGMEYVESSVTPRDAEMLRSRIFTRSEVSSLYGLPAELVEAVERPRDRGEARTQFYADTLPPLLTPIADDLDLQVLEEEYGIEDHFFAFDFSEKLRGMYEDRLKVLVSAAGGPVMTRNEARRGENLEELEGEEFDTLITPLNVTEGGKPSPGVMPVQDPNGEEQDGSGRTGEGDAAEAAAELERAQAAAQALTSTRRQAQADRRDRYAQEHEDLLRDTFKRQEKAYAKGAGTFDLERWDRELADDLEDEAIATVEREGGIAAERLATAGGFDLDRCRKYLRRGAEERAHAINSTTLAAIEEAEADETDASAALPRADAKAEPFEDAKERRAEEGGVAIATSLAAFSHAEAGRQAPDASSRVKTWVVMSGNSRHPQLQGETVPVFETFSNGGQYPGDPKLGVDENARCQCLLEVS